MSKLAVRFMNPAWQDYMYWSTHDKKITAKINKLIEDCTRSPFEGTGKPEPLRENYAGYWSRRINAEHRLVYKATTDDIIIIACRYHYSK